jgi:hypothetical protein
MKANNVRSLFLVLDRLRLGTMSDDGKIALVKTLRNVARVSEDIEHDLARLLSSSEEKGKIPNSFIESEYDVHLCQINRDDMERLILANPDIEIGKFVFISRFIEDLNTD